MSCDGLSGTELQLCRAVEAAEQAAVAATALARGRNTVDQIVALAEAAATLAIPLAVIFLFWRLWPVLRGIFETRKFTVKVGPFELSAQEATDQLRAQIDDLQSKVAALSEAAAPLALPAEPDPFIAPLPASGSTPDDIPIPDDVDLDMPHTPPPSDDNSGSPSRPKGAIRRVLWVDDAPENNAALIAGFERDGIEVVLARNSREGIAQLRADPDHFDVVITDQGRVEDDGRYVSDAGTRLLRQMQETQIDVPSAVFTSPRGVRMKKSAIEAGADIVTDSTTELRGFVLRRTGLSNV